MATPKKVTGVDPDALQRMLSREGITTLHPHRWPMNPSSTSVSFRVDNSSSPWHKLKVTLYQNGSIHFQGPVRVAAAATERLTALKEGGLPCGPTSGSPLNPRRPREAPQPAACPLQPTLHLQ